LSTQAGSLQSDRRDDALRSSADVHPEARVSEYLTTRGLSIYGAGLRIGGEGPRETGQTETSGKILAEEEPP
jgi:hypothetical protein